MLCNGGSTCSLSSNHIISCVKYVIVVATGHIDSMHSMLFFVKHIVVSIKLGRRVDIGMIACHGV
jgi:hypothetical protein